MTGLRMEQRHVVVERRVVRVGSSRFSSPTISSPNDLLVDGTRQPGPVGGVARHDLEPELGHLLGRPLAVGHAARRTVRIVRVLRGVVVGVSIAMVVPAGRNCGRAYRKTPCHSKSQCRI